MYADIERATLSPHVTRAASKLEGIFATTSWSREWGVALIDLLDAFRIEFEDGFVINEDGREALTPVECAILVAYVVREPNKPWTGWLALYVERNHAHKTRRAMAHDLADFARLQEGVRRVSVRREA